MSSSPDCIFCKIASGAIPSLKIFETSELLAFLDVGPLSPGHTLLIPKAHFESVLDVPPDVLSRLAGCLPALSRAVLKVTGATGINILQNAGESAGQVVPHLHLHLIPRRAGDGLGFRWRSGKYSTGEGEAIRDRVIAEIS